MPKIKVVRRRKRRILRFRGISRAVSKGAHALENKVALLQRQMSAGNGGGEIARIYGSLPPAGKRHLLASARVLEKANRK